MADFLQTLETVVAVGSLYALIALGYTMVYGILKFINFAHSDIVVLGAWLSYRIATQVLPRLGIDPESAPWWACPLVLFAAMFFCGLIGFAIEWICYRPLRGAPRLNVLITAIGVSLLLQNVGQFEWAFGKTTQRMPSLLENRELLNVLVSTDADGFEQRLSIGLVDVTIIVTAAILMVLLELLVYRTRLGTAMRAVSYNTETAALMGVPVDRVISITFVLGSVLAAAAGFLHAMKYPGALAQPAAATWVMLGLKAFVAAVVGGIGNLRGAVLGGFLIALIEQFGAFYLSSNLKDFFVFAVLIAMLLVKPTGLLGSPVREKV
jgi:branched-chain amino acid transport system permease protein